MPLKITEGVEGYFYYHLSLAGNKTKSLCGKTVMNTEIPLTTWGRVGHLKERYCKDCANAALTLKETTCRENITG
jgi:hypothetical protein